MDVQRLAAFTCGDCGDNAPHVIRIAAALIDDDAGRLLLVRKAGTGWFMQAGGKIEAGESPMSALRRELNEEIGLTLADDDARYLGRYSAPAANEPGHIVEAEVFHVRVRHDPDTRSEIEEAVWIDRHAAAAMPLAPLTRDHILPLSHTLRPRSGRHDPVSLRRTTPLSQE